VLQRVFFLGSRITCLSPEIWMNNNGNLLEAVIGLKKMEL
jgi:hypothetical protein